MDDKTEPRAPKVNWRRFEVTAREIFELHREGRLKPAAALGAIEAALNAETGVQR
jgi:hypothetical protein